MDPLTERPKVRDDLVIVRLVERGEVIHTYKVLETGEYYRLDETQHRILSFLDGTRTLDEVAAAHNSGSPGLQVDVPFLETYLESVRPTGILERGREEKRRLFLELMRDRRRREANRRMTGNIFEFQISAWDPDRYFDRILPWLRWIYTPGFVVVSAVLNLVMLAIWAAEWPSIQEGTIAMFTFRGMTGRDLLDFFIILFVTGFLHESAHGLTCKYFGGRVTRMGFMFVYFTPCFFVDVSDAYLFDRHYKRQWTIYAGGYVELVVCSFATFVWALTDPGGEINAFAWKLLLMTGLTSLIVNYNPLIKLDGYYSLMDYLEISDLWERSYAYVIGRVKRTLFRLPVELEIPPRPVRRILVGYAVSSIVYKWLLIAAFAIFSRNIFVSLFGRAGYPLVILTLVVLFRGPLGRLAAFLKFIFVDKKEVLMKPRTLLATGAATGALALAAAFLPLPICLRGDFVLEPGTRAIVRASTEGVVERVPAAEGREVRPGEILAVLRNDPLTGRLPALRSRLQFLETGIAEAAYRGERSDLARKESELRLLRDEARALDEKVEGLTLRAPEAGIVVTPRIEDRLGSWLASGETFCEVDSSERLIARVPVREAQVDELRPDQNVDLKVAAFPFRTYAGRVAAIAPASTWRDGGSRPVGASFSSAGGGLADFEALVVIEPAPAELQSGMSGSARIHVTRSTAAARTARALRRWLGSRIW